MPPCLPLAVFLPPGGLLVAAVRHGTRRPLGHLRGWRLLEIGLVWRRREHSTVGQSQASRATEGAPIGAITSRPFAPSSGCPGHLLWCSQTSKDLNSTPSLPMRARKARIVAETAIAA